MSAVKPQSLRAFSLYQRLKLVPASQGGLAAASGCYALLNLAMARSWGRRGPGGLNIIDHPQGPESLRQCGQCILLLNLGPVYPTSPFLADLEPFFWNLFSINESSHLNTDIDSFVLYIPILCIIQLSVQIIFDTSKTRRRWLRNYIKSTYSIQPLINLCSYGYW